ncbi:MAG: recombination mediator RecR [Phycisphaeraceae bacterium]|nr:recombination mediator RecR [Phycisphaeraceae bacterium]
MPSQDPSYTESLTRLIDRFCTLPGIGRRTAERLAFHILKSDPQQALALASAIEEVKKNVRHCSVCFNLTEADPCDICRDDRRDRTQILVVEQPRDVINLEQTGTYRGLYHVLLGHLAPLEGVEPSDLTIDALIERVRKAVAEGPVELILGTNPNLEGDGTSLYIAEKLTSTDNLTLSRLARGLPAGSQLEYANKAVLMDAIASRQSLL